MLSRISYNAFRQDSEGIDRITLSGWPDVRLLGRLIGNIDGQRKQIFDGVNDAHILKDVHGKIGRDFNQDIDIAIRTIVASGP